MADGYINYTPKVIPGGYENFAINTGPRQVFAKRKPAQPPELSVAKLTKDNFQEVLTRMLRTDENLLIPGTRASITLGDKRFDLGEWIIEEVTAGGTTPATTSYRHPTEEEVQTYGLEK